jgi:hypothetical protein
MEEFPVIAGCFPMVWNCTKNSAPDPMTAMTRDPGDDGDFYLRFPFSSPIIPHHG